ncbi:MAG: insulinase family protein [Flavobacteriaceae bacterium]|nr:insulinase family protein [Flavobacteriaceae bacterium]
MNTKAQGYKTETRTDSQGYVYETVTNDPTKSRIYTLKNGLKVYLSRNDDEPKIQTYISVRAGSANDPSDNTGLAHYLEHMMFKGTSKIGSLNWEKESELLKRISDLYEQHKAEKSPAKKNEIYKQIDKISQEASRYAIANEYDKIISELGATGTNAHTGPDETVYKNTIPSHELERWLVVEKERFSELVLRLFHTELEAVYEEFNRAQDNDGRLVNHELMEALFPIHAYGQQTTLGKPEHLKNPSMKAIHDYYRKYYVPNNMAVVLSGDLDFDTAIRLVDRYFGGFPYKELPQEEKEEERPLTSVVKRVVKSPSAERLQIAFRSEGAGTKEALYVKMVSMILDNSGAGLIDVHINQKQKAQGAGSYVSFFTDYGMHALYGVSREGQTLEEVQQLLLEQLEEVKRGNFEDWLIPAIVKDLKVQRVKRRETANGVATQMYNAFIRKQSWQSVLNEAVELDKITKEDVVRFANEFYRDNYVVVYKEKGVNDKLVRVGNPKITPIVLNRTDQSEFYKEFSLLPEKDILPQFVDYSAVIKTENIKDAPFHFIKNNNNGLGELYYIFDFGTDNNHELSLALHYLNFLGTDTYSRPELEQEFYKIGVEYAIQVQHDRIYFSLHGLEENLPKGIKLLEHLLANVKPNSEVYQDYVQTVLKARKDSKLNKQSILNALAQYARFGENNRIRNVIPEQDLLNKNPQELVNISKGLLNYKHDIFYYGPNDAVIKKAVRKYHNFGQRLEYASPVVLYEELVSDGALYFVPYDMVQTEILFQSRGEKFEVSKMPSARVFNEYFGRGLSSIVFQEIRESKSLAYSAYANYSIAMDKNKYDFVSSYLGTQANKLPEAIKTLNELMNHMPEVEKQFENAKKGALKQIASDRITKAGIFWSYLTAKRRGLNHDVRKDIYAEIQALHLSDLRDFFNREIKGKRYNIALIGKKETLDWKAVQRLGTVKELTIDELFNY